MKDHFLDNWANLNSATQIAELFDNYEDVRKVNSKPMDRWGRNDKILTYSGVKEKENRFGKTSPRLGASVPERGFTKLNIDACGPLPITSKGNRYLITAICMSSKFPEAIPVSDISSVSVTDALLNIFSRMGFPREIQCDQGTSFTSALTTEFLKDSEYLSDIVLCIIHRVTLLSDFIER
ncbi:retrovirus-related Pol polyprotein from transposon 412 [Trichonephila clavipes]|nr:retrovirus-related Pol polyprotein from transposon 412 [Trichonephila clavipes]